MNRFKKYYTNVWVAECDDEYKKGDVIELETKYGKEVECEVYNFLGKENNKNLYSIIRLADMTYAERKIEKYQNRVASQNAASKKYYEASQEGKEFLSLAEPIKVGHHSEKRHRALIERNWNRMSKSVEFDKKANESEQKVEYWKRKAEEITLAMPESIDYFSDKLQKAIEYHKGLKDGTIEKEHSYSLTYAKNNVNELTKKVEIAKKLWGKV